MAGTVTVPDPCAVRFEPGIHAAVRNLIGKAGHEVEEMTHAGRRTLCCGEGGAVCTLAPALAATWGKRRQTECNGRKIVTYCAGCANRLSAFAPTEHLLDVLWEGEAGEAKVAKGPFTYWKRLRLKKWFRDHLPAAATRERTFTGAEAPKKKSRAKLLLFLLFLAAALVTVRSFGLSRHLDPETLRTWIAGYGVLAPMVYVALYAVAPVLFLPGLPITVAGGVLFGPLWGVVYAITGATLGACLAFLVSRYLARESVAGQMRSPRWRRLDEGVVRQGWKVVAFTRLIPLFPFNLLNYAFGLTKIGFRPYAVATFFGMLPACIAFIVFSSSLLDLIRGEVSPTFVIGIALIDLVSLFPLFYRRYKAKRGEDDPV